jgi:ELWxxDGT repeat protein
MNLWSIRYLVEPKRKGKFLGFVVLFWALFSLTFVQTGMAGNGTDLDGDGKADLIWRNTSTGDVAIWLMNGTAIGTTGFPGAMPLVWQIAGVGDVNGDGQADVIWRNSANGVVRVWLMNGLTITSVGFPGATSTDWEIQAVGDVNGDGKADIFWRNTNSGVVAIWLMNGVSIGSSGYLGGVPFTWKIAGVGDVNADGLVDVIWRNRVSGVVAVWVMNGLSIATVGFPGSASADWAIQGIGDVDGNGKADLIWRNSTSGVVALWLMNGKSIALSGFLGLLGGVSTEWVIAQVGDVDGDGKTDVIWHNSNTGTVVVWLMNGLSIIEEGLSGSTSTVWEIAGAGGLWGRTPIFLFTVITTGTGSGAVTCNGVTCNASYLSGTVLTLVAEPAATSIFGEWGGDCAEAGTATVCNLTIEDDSNVTATFNPPRLSVVLNGRGTVTSDPPGIDCGATCTASFNNGTSVTLTAAGVGFSGWTGGGCVGTGTCVVPLASNVMVTATFSPSGGLCPAQPTLVKDIAPGSVSSFLTSGNPLVDVNGTLFFRAHDVVHGFELWKSDGTADGTVLVKDIGPGVNTAPYLIPQFLTNVHGTLFFIMDDGVYGLELWKSDGTEAGTVLVKDINPGSNSAFSHLLTDSLVAVGDTLFFSANDGVHGVEIWKSDGTETGTVMVKDIQLSEKDSSPAKLTHVNGILFFAAGDGTNGLWKSDGTEAGTLKLATFDRYPGWLTSVHGTLFFSAWHSSVGIELWRSDGTVAGTTLVKDLNGALNSHPRWLTNVHGTLFFIASDVGIGQALFKSDGTAVGTVLVKAVDNVRDLAPVGDKLYFRTSLPSGGSQPWISDGTDEGTRVLKGDLSLLNLAGSNHFFTDVNGTAFFAANDGVTGVELWKSDGTEEGTVLVEDIVAGEGSNPQNLTNADGTLFFIAESTGIGKELWVACGVP